MSVDLLEIHNRLLIPDWEEEHLPEDESAMVCAATSVGAD